MPFETGQIFKDRYQIGKLIGSGATSNVFEAFDLINKKDVALKISNEKYDKNSSKACFFDNETKILASLNHINIVSIFDAGISDGYLYIVNELVKGKTLKDILDERSYLPKKEAINYLIQLARALSYANNHNIIHRDIKPQNMYIESGDILKLGDFGISSILDSEKGENNKKIVCSVQYVAPEIVLGNDSSAQSDIYSCGIVLYEMLTGCVPFDYGNSKDIMKAQVSEKMPNILKVTINSDKKIAHIIKKSTQKEPKKRYKNIELFLHDLEKYRNSEVSR